MELDDKIKSYVKRILLSRTRLILTNPFYGLLLMHVRFGIDELCTTAYTDGERICFNPEFLENLSDSELDFVLMHELLHVVLRHCRRGRDYDNQAFNVACDIVVNSNIMHSLGDDEKKITLKGYGVLMHETPNGDEGYNYTAEEVYEMLDEEKPKNKKLAGSFAIDGDGNEDGGKTGKEKNKPKNGNGFDEHDKWKGKDGENFEDDVWLQRVKDAVTLLDEKIQKTCGGLPTCVKRLLESYGKAQHDWRTILNNFISEEVNDYSFTPPDRRYQGDFFLPDFNDAEYSVKNILFMIDTSGSMSEKEIKIMYTEIKGAIEQFNGKLAGYLGFFDAAVVEPKEFCGEDEFSVIQAYGGGGTSFQAVFDYVNKNMLDKDLKAIIILTDGYAPFPKKETVPDVPLLWVINNERQTPPVGKILRVKNL